MKTEVEMEGGTNSFTAFIDWWKQRFFLALTLKFLAGLVIGFGLGVYFLPIIVADDPADATIIQAEVKKADQEAIFVRDLPGSDAFHWGEGTLLLSKDRITLKGEVAPGPDYRLYLIPEFADTEDTFLKIKSQSLEIARINGFTNFSYPMPEGVDTSGYKAVLIWCERFGEFITAGHLKTRG